MKYIILITLIGLLLVSCLREKYRGEACFRQVSFLMKDVPYVFEHEQAVGWRPYYTFVEQLNLYIFGEQGIEKTARYDFDYCRSHPLIPDVVGKKRQIALFVANMYDSRELDWTFQEGRLHAWFSILNYEEPPVLLAAMVEIPVNQDTVPIALRMLVSRLEIRLTNPPAWMTGLDITVREVAATVSTDFMLGDTTHIHKQLFFENQGPGQYNFGLNTFPSYPGRAAVLDITPVGTSETAPILVEDDRLHLFPGVITRLNIVFDADEKITISVQIEDKWEIVDGGHIIV